MTQVFDGILVLDKPAGPTSHDIVARVRRITGTKVGHTGTLDPAATGVLPLVLGRATRLSRFIQAVDKEYVAAIRLGIETDSYDAEGRVVDRRPVPRFSEAEINAWLRTFVGEIDQIPPMFSAVKLGGERLYKAARRQETVERSPRRITVFAIDLNDWEPEILKLRIHCSSGTYIRSIAHDLGALIGCGAHLESLRRTRTGEFTLEQSVQVEELEAHWRDRLIPLEQMLSEFPTLDLSPTDAKRVRHGNSITLPTEGTTLSATPIRLFHRGQFVALGEMRQEGLKPILVLRPND